MSQAVTIPDAKVIEKKSSDALTFAGELEIKDDATYKTAGAFLSTLKELQKEIDRTFDDSIEAAHKAHKVIINAKKAHASPLEEAEKIAKWKMRTYYDEQQRLIRLEQERLAEERRKFEAEQRRVAEEHARKVREHEEAVAAQQKKAAEEARAAALANQPPPAPIAPPPPPPPAPPKVMAPPPAVIPKAPAASGVSMRTVRKFEVVNLMELVQAVSMGLAPLSYLQANEVEIRKATNDTTVAEIPGVHFYNETVAAAR